MKCDLEESAPSSKGLYVSAPRKARDEQATHKEQDSADQQQKVQNDIHDRCLKRTLHSALRSGWAGDKGRTQGPDWRKCTAKRRPGPGGVPLVLRLGKGSGRPGTLPGACRGDLKVPLDLRYRPT